MVMVVQKLSDGTYRIKQKDLSPEAEIRIMKNDLESARRSLYNIKEDWARYRSEKSVDPKILAKKAKLVKEWENSVKKKEAEYKNIKQKHR